MNEKEDPVVETWTRNFKNNVILLLNVEVLELVKNEIQTPNKIRQIAIPIVVIAVFV